MANGVKLPDRTGGSVWLSTTDGVGRPRRIELGYPHGTTAALAAGLIDGVVELRGDEGNYYHDNWIVAGPIAAEWGDIGLAAGIKDAVAAGVDEVLAAIEADDDVVTPTLPPTFATDLAAALVAKVAPAVETAAAAGVDRELDAVAD